MRAEDTIHDGVGLFRSPGMGQTDVQIALEDVAGRHAVYPDAPAEH
jgi:hypothetical protein